jgi:hypothetical protein
MRLFVPSARQAEDVRWNFVLGWADASTQSDCVVSQALSRIEIDTKAENIAADFTVSLPSPLCCRGPGLLGNQRSGTLSETAFSRRRRFVEYIEVCMLIKQVRYADGPAGYIRCVFAPPAEREKAFAG